MPEVEEQELEDEQSTEEQPAAEDETPPPTPAMAGPAGTRHKREPTLGFLYSVEVRGGPFGLFTVPVEGYFTQVSGLAVEYEVIEFKTTNVAGLPARNQYPGRPIYSPVTLQRGVTNSEAFWLWHQMLIFGLKGPLLTATITLTIYDRTYTPMAAFEIERAWPSKVSGVDVRSDSNDVLIEEMVLQHGGVSRDIFSGELQLVNTILQSMVP